MRSWFVELHHYNLLIKQQIKEKGIQITKDLISHFSIQLLKIQMILFEFNKKNDNSFMLFELLEKRRPMLAKAYGNISPNDIIKKSIIFKENLLNLMKEYDILTWKKLKKSSKKPYSYNKFQKFEKKKEFIGPREAELELEYFQQLFSFDLVKKDEINFKFVEKVDQIAEIIETIEMSYLNQSTQENWNNILVKIVNPYYAPHRYLKISGLNQIKSGLENLLIHRSLKSLILHNCYLTDDCALILAANCPLLKTLDLSYNQTLTRFDEEWNLSEKFASLIKGEKRKIAFESLQNLVLNDCYNLKNIKICADLKVISLKNCKVLASYYLDFRSLGAKLELIDVRGVYYFSEQEILSVLNTDCEIFIDSVSCKGYFSNILKEFEKFPKLQLNLFPSVKNFELFLLALQRKENLENRNHLILKDFSFNEVSILSNELKKEKKRKENDEEENFLLKKVEILGVSFSGITNLRSTTSIVNNILGLMKVEDLSFQNCNLGNYGAKAFGEVIRDSLNEENDESKKTMPKSESFKYLPVKIPINKREFIKKEVFLLKHLNLNGTKIGNEGVNYLFPYVLQLKRLELANNGINIEGIQTICTNFFEKNSKLDYLDLSENFLNDECFKLINKCIIEINSPLKILKLNGFSEQNIPEQETFFSKTFTDIKKQFEKPINKTSVSDYSLIELMEGLNKNSNLKEIYLENWNFSENQAKEFVKFFKDVSNLTVLSLVNKNLNKENFFIEKTEVKNEEFEKNEEIDKEKFNEKEQFEEKKEKLQFPSRVDSKRDPLVDNWVIGLGIDGGGARGIIPAIMIDQICQQAKKPVHSLFDCVGGTSIGGILALGYCGTLDGKTPVISSDVGVVIFLDFAHHIFGKSKSNLDRFGILTSRYDEWGLEGLLSKYLGVSLLSDALTNVIVPAVYKDSFEMMIFRSMEAFVDPEKDFLMRSVGRATSAAPTYFPAAEITNLAGTKRFSLVDGGVGKNDPTSFVMTDIQAEAVSRGTPNNFFALSIGTGINPDEKLLAQEGIVEVKNILNKAMGAHIELDIATMKNKFGKTRYRRFNPMLSNFKNMDLDNIEKEQMNRYKELSLEEAEKFLEEDFGPYQDRSLAEWLAENADRKNELF